MRIRPGIEVDDSALADFCLRHHIARLALYGSSLRGDFTPRSDVDVLVQFDAGHIPGLLRLAEMEIELGRLMGGAEVELRTYEDLSRFFRDEVRASARQLYAA
ncbi:MAG TPA: nucleotidyltransferase domain-containing protein [Streptosporangiaceae bacterium]|nr:nucleotidyltransferase domain-containing protein [Streptosporangiaceae bacterium]